MTEQTLSQQLLAIIIPFAATALSILTTWALYELKKFIKARTGSAELEDSMIVLENVIQGVVTEINETLKAVGADGKLSAADAKLLKERALKSIGRQLPPATKKILDKNIAHLGSYVSGKVEVAVLSSKLRKGGL